MLADTIDLLLTECHDTPLQTCETKLTRSNSTHFRPRIINKCRKRLSNLLKHLRYLQQNWPKLEHANDVNAAIQCNAQDNSLIQALRQIRDILIPLVQAENAHPLPIQIKGKYDDIKSHIKQIDMHHNNRELKQAKKQQQHNSKAAIKANRIIGKPRNP